MRSMEAGGWACDELDWYVWHENVYIHEYWPYCPCVSMYSLSKYCILSNKNWDRLTRWLSITLQPNIETYGTYIFTQSWSTANLFSFFRVFFQTTKNKSNLVWKKNQLTTQFTIAVFGTSFFDTFFLTFFWVFAELQIKFFLSFNWVLQYLSLG